MLSPRKSRGAVLAAVIACTLSAPAFAQQPADKPAAPAKPADKPAAPTAPAAKPATPATPAAPAAKPADPKALLTSADKKSKDGDHAGALADYEAANAAKASPEAQLGVAKSLDALGRFPEAVTAYEKLVADNPAAMKTQVEDAKKRVEAIKAMPAKVNVVTTPTGASITVDGSQTPLPETTPAEIQLAPGKHTIRVAAEGYEPQEKEVDATYGGKPKVEIELVKKAEPPAAPPPVTPDQPVPTSPTPAPPPEPRSKVPAYVTGAVAIVAAGVGTGFGIKALQQSSDFEKNPTTKKADDGENNALVADMMFGIAITFGVTSAVLFLSSDAPASAKAQSPKVAAPAPKKNKPTIIPAPYITPSGGGIGTVVSF